MYIYVCEKVNQSGLNCSSWTVVPCRTWLLYVSPLCRFELPTLSTSFCNAVIGDVWFECVVWLCFSCRYSKTTGMGFFSNSPYFAFVFISFYVINIKDRIWSSAQISTSRKRFSFKGTVAHASVLIWYLKRPQLVSDLDKRNKTIFYSELNSLEYLRLIHLHSSTKRDLTTSDSSVSVGTRGT